jgi:hypothetical protein
MCGASIVKTPEKAFGLVSAVAAGLETLLMVKQTVGANPEITTPNSLRALADRTSSLRRLPRLHWIGNGPE